MEKTGTHICKDIQLRDCINYDASHLLGAPFPVTLTGGVKEKYCNQCGATKGHLLKDPLQLIAMVAVLRACNDMKLNGSEVRFLRKSMSYKAKHLAEKLDLAPAHLSRIENDKVPMSLVYEKLLRAAVCLHYIDAAKCLGVDVSHVLSMEVTSAKCVSKSFHLVLCLVEKESVLRVVGEDTSVVSSNHAWKDDCGPKVAV